MNRLMKMLMAGLMVLSLVGCAKKEEPAQEEEPVNMVNPMTEVGSLEELNKECNTRIVKPGAMGVSDEKFFVINSESGKIAEYTYTIAGRECTIRNANIINEDISGWWPGGVPAFGNEPKEGIEYSEADSAYLARWFTLDGQFVFIMNKTEGVDEEYFKSISREVATVSGLPDPEAIVALYKSLVGNYQDSVSQRASMEVATNDGSALMVDIRWASSAEETTEWILTMKLGEDGLYNYDDCCKRVLKNDEATVVYENGTGFFSLTEDGVFLWNGAADEECKDCAFEKVD